MIRKGVHWSHLFRYALRLRSLVVDVELCGHVPLFTRQARLAIIQDLILVLHETRVSLRLIRRERNVLHRSLKYGLEGHLDEVALPRTVRVGRASRTVHNPRDLLLGHSHGIKDLAVQESYDTVDEPELSLFVVSLWVEVWDVLH